MADHRMTKYSGFTLIELMAAITIIGILASMAVGLDFSRMNDREKRDRLVNAIVSTVRSEDTRRTTGKGIGTDLTHPSQTQIALSSSGVEVTYLSGSTITGTGILLQTPLYGESGYKINTPQLLHIDGTLKTPLSTGEIVYIEL